MSLRGLWLATQFLSRLPVPNVKDFSPRDLSRSAPWFPFVGLVLGALVTGVIVFTRFEGPLLAAAVGVLAWTWLTGALHLDGLADLTDAMGAAHGNPDRFLAVLSDPHVGSFGVVSIVLALLLKFAALAQLGLDALLAAPLVLAWARLGPLCWSRWLAPLKPGQGERFAWSLSLGWIVLWTAVLSAASAALMPSLCVAPIVIALWGVWLHYRVGGVTGDCLGAGVEVVEIVLLATLALSGNLGAPLRMLF